MWPRFTPCTGCWRRRNRSRRRGSSFCSFPPLANCAASAVRRYVFFTASATEPLNQALFGLLIPGDKVVTTGMEHNAVLCPLKLLRLQGVQVTRVVGGSGGDSASPRPPSQLPEGLESGTANTSGLAGLKAGVEFILATGLDVIHRHELNLVQILRRELPAVAGLDLYDSGTMERQGPVISFTTAGHAPGAFAFLLGSKHEICVRAGLHCAPAAHRTLGTFSQGTVRLSPGWFNTERDIAVLLTALNERVDC